MNNRICHLLISYGNRNQSYTKELLEGLKTVPGNFHFVYTHRKIEDSPDLLVIESLKKMSFDFLIAFVKVFLKNKDFLKICKICNRAELYRWVRLFQYDIDVLHIHHAHAISHKVLKFFKQKGFKIVISLRGRDLLVNTAQKKDAEELKKKLLLADHIHVISHYMNYQLKEKYDLIGEVVYRGQYIPEEKYKKNTERKTDKPLAILVVGRLVWEKGHMYLLESISKLKEKGVSVKVDIFGSGTLNEFLSYRINQLGIENEVSLRGFVDNNKLKKLYKNYDVFVQPSVSEALSNALIDAMLCNLPCVITNVGGMPEIINHQSNGIIIDPMQMEELEVAILNAASMKIERIKTYNQLENVNKFSKANEVKQLTALYDS